MNEMYGEFLVKRKSRYIDKVLYIVLYVLGGLFIATSLVLLMPVVMVVGAAAAVGGYIIKNRSDIEYEYLYIDRTITIDKIFSKNSRKKAGEYSVDKINIMAKISAERLAEYKDKPLKTEDFSEHDPATANQRYVIIYDNKKRILIQADEGFLKMIRTIAPNKVFM